MTSQRLENEPVLLILELIVVQRLLVLDVVLHPQEHDRLIASRRQDRAIVVPPHDIHRFRMPLQIRYEIDLNVGVDAVLGVIGAFVFRFLTLLGQLPDLPKYDKTDQNMAYFKGVI